MSFPAAANRRKEHGSPVGHPGRLPPYTTFNDYAVTGTDEHPSAGTERTPLAPVLAKATLDLAAAGVDSPRVDAELLAAHVLGVNRGRLALIDTIRDVELRRFAGLIAARAERIPLQHLMGTAAFRHLELAAGEGVFVPRPETELLAGWGIAHTAPGATVVDLGSGTGAIALSVVDEARPGRVIAVERSPAALAWTSARPARTRLSEAGN